MWRILSFILYFTGLLKLWRFVHRNDVVIMVLHGVMDYNRKEDWTPLRPQIHVEYLEKVIKWLSRYYNFISMDEAVEILSGKRHGKSYPIVFTFDDGYRNNIKFALPILEKYNVPAIIYITTGYIENRKPFWFDRLDYALQHSNISSGDLKVGDDTIKIKSDNRSSLRESYKKLRDFIKNKRMTDTKMLKVLEDASETLESGNGKRLMDIFENDNWSSVLTWQEIREASDRGVSFGSHTVDHIRLGYVSDDIVYEQLQVSKDMIERRTGNQCVHLCYPDGSCDERVSRIAGSCGYVSAVTTEYGINKIEDKLTSLRRIAFPMIGNKWEVLTTVSGIKKLFRRM